MDDRQSPALTAPSFKSPMASLREQSVSTIRTAILSPHDSGACLRRIVAVLGLYYDPDQTPEAKALTREEFVRALDGKPDWAVQRAFDTWTKTGTRRPSPGEILILIERELAPMGAELARREKFEREQAEAAREAAVTPEMRKAANDILQNLGFTADRSRALERDPLAGSNEALERAMAPTKHWSETAPPDDPRWEILRKSRAASTVAPTGVTP